MTDHTERMLADWSPGETVDVHFQMARVTVQIICEAMFDVELGDDRAAELRDALVPVGNRFEPDPRRVVIPEWVPT
jgi:cytochrome P450